MSLIRRIFTIDLEAIFETLGHVLRRTITTSPSLLYRIAALIALALLGWLIYGLCALGGGEFGCTL